MLKSFRHTTEIAMTSLHPPNQSLSKRKSEEDIGQDKKRSEWKNDGMQIFLKMTEQMKKRELARKQQLVHKEIRMRKQNLVALCCNCGFEREFRHNECTECCYLSSRCSECLLARSQNREE